jgi:hypothetical protein
MNQAITFSTLIMAAGLATAGGVGTVDHDPLPTIQRATADQDQGVGADRKLTHWGCGVKLGLVYAVNPRLSRYSMGLSEPKDILIRFSLYQ